MTDWIKPFIEESNKIEGIFTEVTKKDIIAFTKFLDKEIITISSLEEFVSHFQPGAVLRDRRGQDVYIGDYTPPSGGEFIIENLKEDILAKLNKVDPYIIHCRYERLHPFTDGNGRSGRAIFAWQAFHHYSIESHPGCFKSIEKLGFLHTWYYESLSHA